MTGPGSGAQCVEEGVIAILYRGHLISSRDWNEGSSVAVEWQPSENVKADDGRTYGDHLCVRIRSTGAIRSKRSYEAANGLVVRIDATTGDIYLQTTKDGGETFENVVDMVKGSGPVSADAWHSIRVEDTGKTISVDFDGKAAVLTAELPADAPKGKVWGFYNREPVGPGAKVSKLRKVHYVSLPQ